MSLRRLEKISQFASARSTSECRDTAQKSYLLVVVDRRFFAQPRVGRIRVGIDADVVGVVVDVGVVGDSHRCFPLFQAAAGIHRQRDAGDVARFCPVRAPRRSRRRPRHPSGPLQPPAHHFGRSPNFVAQAMFSSIQISASRALATVDCRVDQLAAATRACTSARPHSPKSPARWRLRTARLATAPAGADPRHRPPRDADEATGEFPLVVPHDLVRARQGSGGFDGCIVKRAATQDFCARPFEDAEQPLACGQVVSPRHFPGAGHGHRCRAVVVNEVVLAGEVLIQRALGYVGRCAMSSTPVAWIPLR